MEIKTIKDLRFDDSPNNNQAIIRFDNDYGVSVIRGDSTISDDDHPFELAVIHFDKDGSFSLIYPSFTGTAIIGHLNDDDVSYFMQVIQNM